MINDNKTNYLYLADSLPKKFRAFYKRFTKVLEENTVPFSLIPDTKDIWCRDYMPIQNSLNKLICFEYSPDYLMDVPQIRTDNHKVCDAMGLNYYVNYVNLDGGNVIHYNNTVIMCDKVLNENAWKYDKKEILQRLRYSFRANRIIFIPNAPDDLFGHADGVVRFVKSNLVLINKFRKQDEEYKLKLIQVLEKAKLKYIEVPYNPYNNRTNLDATGIYLNYLQMKGVVFVPVYGLKEDKQALEILKSVFPKEKIVPVRSNEIAKQGGVLNCISWNIRKANLK